MIGRLPHLGLGAGRARRRRGRASRRRRTASSSAPPLATVGGDHRHVQRHHLVLVLAEAADRQQRQVAGRGRRCRRTCSPPGGAGRSASARRRPSRSTPSTIRVDADVRAAVWANGMLQLRREHLGEVAAAVAAVEVLDRVVRLRRHPLGRSSGTACRGRSRRLEADRRGQHLERRARHVALLVGVGEQRLAGSAFEERRARRGRRRSRGRRRGSGRSSGSSTSPARRRSCGSITTTEPSRSPSASLATCWRSSRIVMRTVAGVVAAGDDVLQVAACCCSGGAAR